MNKTKRRIVLDEMRIGEKIPVELKIITKRKNEVKIRIEIRSEKKRIIGIDEEDKMIIKTGYGKNLMKFDKVFDLSLLKVLKMFRDPFILEDLFYDGEFLGSLVRLDDDVWVICFGDCDVSNLSVSGRVRWYNSKVGVRRKFSDFLACYEDGFINFGSVFPFRRGRFVPGNGWSIGVVPDRGGVLLDRVSVDLLRGFKNFDFFWDDFREGFCVRGGVYSGWPLRLVFESVRYF